MKAIRKSDGKVIEVREWFGESDVVYSDLDMNRFYQASDLDFSINEEATIDAWVARDEYGDIYVYKNKPTREDDVWTDDDASCLLLPITSFPSLTWESEPLEVTITIKPKKK